MRNRYGTLYNDAMEEVVLNQLKGNGVLFARSVTTGALGTGFLWGGDNEANFSTENGFPTVVTAGISAGISGMPLWGADIGGYLKQPDTPNPLLLERWTEFAAFTPLMEVMSSANIVPWTFDKKSGDKNSPSGTPALDIYRRYAVLHMSLFPYRYAAAQQSVKTGMPLIRALVLNYQDDPKARLIKDEYLFGPDLLVAPVIDENTSRVVYLPTGQWLNLFTGEPITGPKTVIANAPVDTIPVYARRGTILPKIPEDVMTLVPASESGNKSVHTLDDRRVYEILGPAATTATSITDFEGRTVLRSDNTLTINGDKPAHVILRWRFVIPSEVTVDGKPATLKNDASGLPTVEFGFGGSANIAWNERECTGRTAGQGCSSTQTLPQNPSLGVEAGPAEAGSPRTPQAFSPRSSGSAGAGEEPEDGGVAVRVLPRRGSRHRVRSVTRSVNRNHGPAVRRRACAECRRVHRRRR